MGDTGPCGPCSEVVFYRSWRAYLGWPPGPPEEDGDRFIELLEVFFMAFQSFLADGHYGAVA